MLALMLALLTTACHKTDVLRPNTTQATSSLEQIKEKGRLVVIADYNATSYFLYRGTPMGLNYELLRAFSDELGVQLSVTLNTSQETSYNALADGSADIMAVEQPVSQDRNHLNVYTDPLYLASPVLVQRRPSKVGDQALVKNVKELDKRVIYVEKGSPFLKTLSMLSIESGDVLDIREHPEYKTEQLINAVSNGEIDVTVAYEPVAKIHQRYHRNLDIQTEMGHGQNLVWLMNQGSDDLLNVFNTWLSGYKKSKKFAILFEKYYYSDRTVNIVGSELYSVKGGKISLYDNAIRKHSKLLNWDWRLLASLIYRESRFHPEAEAWSGAYGLMQLMPDVAEKYDIDSLSDPDKQIQAGVRYLASLDKQFKDIVPDREERIKFVLAAYNVGLGHVLDARRLAAKNGKNNNIWTNQVDSFLLRKSEPRFYQDKVAYYGYCRGEEPFAFVRDVMEVYHLYRNAIQN